MADSDEIEVALDDPVDEKDKKSTTSSSDELAALRRTVEDKDREVAAERERSAAAEKERDELRNKIRSTVDDQVRSSETSIENAIAAHDRDVKSLQKDYTEALRANKHDRAAEINDRLLDAKLNLRDARASKQRLATWKEQQVAAAEAAATRGGQGEGEDDGLSDPTRRWLKEHPEAKPGGRQYHRAMAAHNLAMDAGHKVDTPEYFSYIEEFMAEGKAPARREQDPDTRQTTQRSSATPPSRGNGSGGDRGASRNTIRLTASEQDLARNMTSLGKTEDERIRNYALNKKRAIDNGEIPGEAA